MSLSPGLSVARSLVLIEAVFFQYREQLLSEFDRVGPLAFDSSPVWATAQASLVAGWEAAIKLTLLVHGTRALHAVSAEHPELFRLDNPHAVVWLREHGAKLVTYSSTQTKLAVRQVIVAGLQEHKTWQQIAADLRPQIGLRPDQQRVLAKYRNLLEFKQAKGELSESAVNERWVRKAAQLINQRAELIARTEIQFGQSAGQQIAWLQARDMGLIRPGWVRKWVAGPEPKRTCKHCRALNGSLSPIDNSWVVPDTGAAVRMPPLHPRCRCRMVLVYSPEVK